MCRGSTGEGELRPCSHDGARVAAATQLGDTLDGGGHRGRPPARRRAPPRRSPFSRSPTRRLPPLHPHRLVACPPAAHRTGHPTRGPPSGSCPGPAMRWREASRGPPPPSKSNGYSIRQRKKHRGRLRAAHAPLLCISPARCNARAAGPRQGERASSMGRVHLSFYSLWRRVRGLGWTRCPAGHCWRPSLGRVPPAVRGGGEVTSGGGQCVPNGVDGATASRAGHGACGGGAGSFYAAERRWV